MKKIKITFITINVICCLIIIGLFFIPENAGKSIYEFLSNKVIPINNGKPILAENIDIEYESVEYFKHSDNEYEEEVINHKSDDVYKLVKLKVDGVNGFMLVVYDPANVKMMISPAFNTPDNSGKERILDMVKRHGALAGVNGGGFFDNGKDSIDIPQGYIIKDSKIIWRSSKKKGNIIGFSKDNKLMMINATGEEALEQGMRDGLEFGPFLMIDGKITKEAEEMATKRSSRIILAQRDDDIVLIFATDGGTVGGAKMSSIIETVHKFGANNIANLDGGASSQMVVDGELVTRGNNAYGYPSGNGLGRLVVNGWGVFAPEK